MIAYDLRGRGGSDKPEKGYSPQIHCQDLLGLLDHFGLRKATLILRAPDGLLTATDCLMTEEEARALAHAIPKSKLVVIPNTNHYTVLMGRNPKVKVALRSFLTPR